MTVPTRSDPIGFSIVILTYARDHILPQIIAHTLATIGSRPDVEMILVDNNPDAIDRSAMLAGFTHSRVVKIGRNIGVVARNEGLAIAQGEIMAFIDDDAFVYPATFLEELSAAFASDPQAGLVGGRHLDSSGRTPSISFPHTDKTLPQDRAMATFRFQGNCFAVRRSALATIGLMSADFFYGLEEIDYAYRVLKAGYHILYWPGFGVYETNDPGGRRPARQVQEMRLTNKFIISYLHMPGRYLLPNLFLFMVYLAWRNRFRLNVFAAIWRFLRWLGPNWRRRDPIGAAEQAYIRGCGGQVWK